MDTQNKSDTTTLPGKAYVGSEIGSSKFSGGNDLPKKDLKENAPYVPVAKKTTDDKINMPNPI